jgi:hypothetical protein
MVPVAVVVVVARIGVAVIGRIRGQRGSSRHHSGPIPIPVMKKSLKPRVRNFGD